MTRGFWTFLILSVLFSSTAARAQTPPAACSATRDASAYYAGYLTGGSFVRQAWSGVMNDCDRIEAVELAVATALRRSLPTTSPTTYLQCRFAGLAQGAMGEVDGLFATCADQCYLEGQFVGEIAAITYCELSILLQGLGIADLLIRGPVQTCGLSFEIACDANFETTAIGYRNPFGQCLPYVRAPYSEVFEQARYNQCAYEPIEPEYDSIEPGEEYAE